MSVVVVMICWCLGLTGKEKKSLEVHWLHTAGSPGRRFLILQFSQSIGQPVSTYVLRYVSGMQSSAGELVASHMWSNRPQAE